MTKAPCTIDVIFRRCPDGDIIAMFPGIAGTSDYDWTCQAYMHIGQHAPASTSLLRSFTTPAKPEQYADLLAELSCIYQPYTLRIVKRETRKHLEERRK